METTCMVRGTQLKGAAYTYTIEKILGQGTFGITYLATSKVQIDGALGALETTLTVAIKEFFMHDLNGRRGNEVTCSSQGGIYEHYRRKFAREAQNLSKLRHPNIVRVLESFEANNTVYYAMEFCEGGSLDELISEQGGLSEAVALDYARQIGSALDYMHGEKILHLDLKPGNVMLRKNGSVALIDFGLSKQYDEEGAPESSTTIGGGTPGYAPIEQANYREGGQFAAAIDVYALGATLFKMLTGERPAEASVLLNEGFPAEKLTAKGVSARTIAVVAKAMEGLKRNRYATVAEFLKTLDGTAATPPVAPAPEEKTIYNDPAAEATVIDEAPKPASAPQPKPQPAPVPTPPKKKGSNMWLWILLLLLLIVGGLVVSRIITKPMAEQAVIEESVEEQPAIEYSDSMGFVAPAPQQTDADRLAQEKAAEERRLAKEKAAKEKAEQERLAAEKAERERLAAENAAKEKAEKERLAAEKAAKEKAEAAEQAERLSGKGRNGVYKVGDYYNVNGKEGVVFYVNKTGRHGKIVSLTQSSEELQWSSNKREQKRLIGASSKTDGAANMRAVQQRPNWRSDYPAFAWCARLGAGWYLPAIEELKLFTLNNSVHDAVNRTLAAKGCTRLYNRGVSEVYWSSTEDDYKRLGGVFCAWYVYMYDGSTFNEYKSYDFPVRAVSTF